MIYKEPDANTRRSKAASYLGTPIVKSFLLGIGGASSLATIFSLIWSDTLTIMIALAFFGWGLVITLLFAHERDTAEIANLKERLVNAEFDVKEERSISRQHAATIDEQAAAISVVASLKARAAGASAIPPRSQQPVPPRG